MLPILILQHPQEPHVPLGTVEILRESIPECVLKVGLTWPNIKKLLGPEAEPARWGVLYFGSGLKAESHTKFKPGLYFANKKGSMAPPPNERLHGIVVLDGTWSQAKGIWWKNPWLLKLKRLVLYPKERSLYGEKRREPKPECVSTLEAVAETLTFLGEDPAIEKRLKEAFARFLQKGR